MNHQLEEGNKRDFLTYFDTFQFFTLLYSMDVALNCEFEEKNKNHSLC